MYYDRKFQISSTNVKPYKINFNHISMTLLIFLIFIFFFKVKTKRTLTSDTRFPRSNSLKIQGLPHPSNLFTHNSASTQQCSIFWK